MSKEKPNLGKPKGSKNLSPDVHSNIAPIFQILQSEQNILQRTDQKAFTLMSILGVFMVFFIVHFLKINITYFNVVMVIIYFIAALFAIGNLMLVIVPRLRNDQEQEELPDINATFFGGIIQFKNPVEYANYLFEVTKNSEETYMMFSSQLYALGHINSYKNKHLRRAIIFFGTAILSELFIIMSMAWGRAWQFLFNT